MMNCWTKVPGNLIRGEGRGVRRLKSGFSRHRVGATSISGGVATMHLRLLVCLVLVTSFSGFAHAQDADAIRDKLDTAKADYQEKTSRIHDTVLKLLDDAQKKAAKAGAAKKVNQIGEDRDAYEKDETRFPKSINTREPQRQWRRAARDLVKAYKQARTAYTKKMLKEEAAGVDTELANFLSKYDLFKAGTTWRGAGGYPDQPGMPRNVDFELTVTKRDGIHFEGESRAMNGRFVLNIKGTAENGLIKWKTVRAVKGSPHNSTTTGTISGDEIVFEVVHENDEGKAVYARGAMKLVGR